MYSLWCHLRKVLGPVKLSEWMECFFRRPRSTFFHRGTSVCLFLFQIHSIIPDCSKHSRTFQEPHIPFSTPARITNHHHLPPPRLLVLFFFFFSIHSSSRMDVAQEKTLSFSFALRAEEFGLDEGKPSYFRHTWLVHCAAIKEMSESRHGLPAGDEAAPKAAPLICLV